MFGSVRTVVYMYRPKLHALLVLTKERGPAYACPARTRSKKEAGNSLNFLDAKRRTSARREPETEKEKRALDVRRVACVGGVSGDCLR